jgi:hypothetical protein
VIGSLKVVERDVEGGSRAREATAEHHDRDEHQ